MSKFLPRPQPIAVTRSDSSLFSSTFASDALSVFNTLPRSGRIAWRARSRPCLADPPAESPFTIVFGDERHAFRREVVRLDVVAHRFREAGAESALVRAARSGRDAVDVRAQVLVGCFRPLQHDVEPQVIVYSGGPSPPEVYSGSPSPPVTLRGGPFAPLRCGDAEWCLVYRLRATLGDDLSQVFDQPFGVLEDGLRFRRFVLEDDLQSLVQVAGDLEAVFDD